MNCAICGKYAPYKIRDCDGEVYAAYCINHRKVGIFVVGVM